MKLSALCLFFLSSLHSVSAQTAVTLAGAGYTAPAAPIPVVAG